MLGPLVGGTGVHREVILVAWRFLASMPPTPYLRLPLRYRTTNMGGFSLFSLSNSQKEVSRKTSLGPGGAAGYDSDLDPEDEFCSLFGSGHDFDGF